MSTGEAKTSEQLQSLRIDPALKVSGRGRRGWLWGLILGICLGMILITALRNARPQPVEVTTAPVHSAEEAVAQQSQSRVLLSGSGYVTPRHRVALSPRVMGQAVWVGIEKGQKVEKDQVLVRLRDDDYQAQAKQARAGVTAAEARLAELQNGTRPEEIARAEAAVRQARVALDNAERLLARRRTLFTDNQVDTEQAFDDAQAARDMAAANLESVEHTLELLRKGPREETIRSAQAELEAARAALEYAEVQVENTVIRAPIQGTILEKLVEVGELVSPQSFGGSRGARTELLSLADLSDLQVELDINQSDFAKVRMSQSARVILDAYPDTTYSARVREIAPEADRQKATVQIKVAILEPDSLVLPEMSARVDLFPEAPSAATATSSPDSSPTPAGVWIPRTAVVESGGQYHAYVAAENRASKRLLSVDPKTPGPTPDVLLVVQGLRAGERVIVSPPAALRDRQLIKVR